MLNNPQLSQLIESRRGQELVMALQAQESDVGQGLMSLARELLELGRGGDAAFVFSLFVRGVDDVTQQEALLRLWADICLKAGDAPAAARCFLESGPDPRMSAWVVNHFAGEHFLVVAYLAGWVERYPDTRWDDGVNAWLAALRPALAKDAALQERRRALLEKNIALIEEYCFPGTAVSLRAVGEYCGEAATVFSFGENLLWVDEGGGWRIAGKINAVQLESRRRELQQTGERWGICCLSPLTLRECVALHAVEEGKNIVREGRVVVMDFVGLYASLSAIDLEPFFSVGYKVNFLDSRNLLNSYLQMFSGNPGLPPTKYISWDVGAEPLLRSLLRVTTYIEQAVTLERDFSRSEIARHYRGRTFPFSTDGCKRVLLITTRHSTYVQHCIRDLAWGFERIGCRTLVVKENPWDGVGVQWNYSEGAIASFRPDLVFCIDYLRSDFGFLLPPELPFVTWVQDLLPSLTKPGVTFGENDYVYTFSPDMVEALRQKNEVYRKIEIGFLPVSVSTDVYHPLEGIEKDIGVSYVSHMYHPRDTWLSVLDGGYPVGNPGKRQKRFLRFVVENLGRISLFDVRRLLENDYGWFAQEVCRQAGLEYSDDLAELLNLSSDSQAARTFNNHLIWLFKSIPVRVLIEHGIDVWVYGNNWEMVPGCERAAQGVVANGDDLNLLINRTWINLNLNPYSTYHMRAPEVLAAGGLLLSWDFGKKYDKSSISDFFDEDREVVFFHDEKDLLEKVKFCLDQNDWVTQVSERAHARFVNHYAFDKIAEHVLRKLKGISSPL